MTVTRTANKHIRLAVLAMLVVLGAPVLAAETLYRFDIGAQDLGAALRALGQAAKQQIVFDESTVRGKLSPRLAGSLSVKDALDHLLTGTGLRAGRSELGVIVIEKDSGASGHALQLTLAGAASSAAPPPQGAVRDTREDQQVTVEDTRIKTSPGLNADLPRTIDDEQPYYIFDSQTLARSGVLDVEEFLKTRLTMNATSQTMSQNPGGAFGNTSMIDLRGLGVDKTLILINGRRSAAVSRTSATYQPDINGIPLGAIDRIEVLPSSASGIYGGSAIGGVINVVLKQDYSASEMRLAYDDTWDNKAPNRKVSATLGRSLEGGKTQFMVTGQWSRSQPLLFGDRHQLVERGLGTVLRNDPSLVYDSSFPFLGAATNIVPSSFSVAQLVLADGRALGSRRATVPLGTAPGISRTDLGTALLQNAGRWNLDLPRSIQSPTGLLRPVGSTPTLKSIMATVRRQLGSRVEAFAEVSRQSNRSESQNDPFSNVYLTVPVSTVAAPSANPFTTPVRITFPGATAFPNLSATVARRLTGGLSVRLPAEWSAGLDYSWSDSKFRSSSFISDLTSMNADAANGTLNPFVDTLRYPLNLRKYGASSRSSGVSSLTDLTLRGSGPLPFFSRFTPVLTVGLEHRVGRTSDQVSGVNYPVTIANSFSRTDLPLAQTTDSGYAELQIPLVTRGVLPLLHGLDLQIAGRSERYAVDVGTYCYRDYYNNPSRSAYCPPTTLQGQPFRETARYASDNLTFGFKYQPVEGVSLRASLATAFLPPSFYELTPTPETYTTQLIDPRTGLGVSGVEITTGGNPDLVPQNSRSLNVGLIWQPTWRPLRNLRMNLEYYKIDQFDQIGSLGAQAIVNAEAVYPDRVTRDAGGEIVAVDETYQNLYLLRTEGVDLTLDYRFTTRLGDFSLHAVQTRILHDLRQWSFDLPLYEHAGFVNEGGPGKMKSNATLTFDRQNWSLAWTGYYFGSYKQHGADGGPYSVSSGGGTVGYIIPGQGSDTIPSQIYHDLFVSYSFGKMPSAGGSKLAAWGSDMLDGVTLQMGIRNVFDTIPPLDAAYSNMYYISPYGDKRLRNYWLNLSKRF